MHERMQLCRDPQTEFALPEDLAMGMGAGVTARAVLVMGVVVVEDEVPDFQSPACA